MATAARNKFHTILSEGTRPDIVRSEIERHQIEQQVGEYIVVWGFVDFSLSLAASAWADSTKSGALQRYLLPQSTSTKIEFLEGLLPEEWRDGKRLVELLKKANTHRNTLAHSNLAMGGWDGTKSLGWHFWNVRGRSEKRLEINGRMLADQLVAAKVLREAMLAIMQDEFMSAGTDINAVSLANAIVQQPGSWTTTEEHLLFQTAARKMFPN